MFPISDAKMKIVLCKVISKLSFTQCVKQEPTSQNSMIDEAKELKLKHKEIENIQKNESKRRKAPMKITSDFKFLTIILYILTM